jgi:hypothetical protein
MHWASIQANGAAGVHGAASTHTHTHNMVISYVLCAFGARNGAQLQGASSLRDWHSSSTAVLLKMKCSQGSSMLVHWFFL